MEKEHILIDFCVENPNLYRVAWKSKKKGIRAGGEYISTMQAAIRAAKKLNRLFPEYHHWVEPNPRLN